MVPLLIFILHGIIITVFQVAITRAAGGEMLSSSSLFACILLASSVDLAGCKHIHGLQFAASRESDTRAVGNVVLCHRRRSKGAVRLHDFERNGMLMTYVLESRAVPHSTHGT